VAELGFKQRSLKVCLCLMKNRISWKRRRKIAVKEATWNKKQIQTIRSATHTVTAKLQEGKTEVLELMRISSDLEKNPMGHIIRAV